jgi:hypothetical protein
MEINPDEIVSMVIEKGGKLRVKEVAERLGVEEHEIRDLWIGLGKRYRGVHIFQEDNEWVLCTDEWLRHLVAKLLDEAREEGKNNRKEKIKERVEETLEAFL